MNLKKLLLPVISAFMLISCAGTKGSINSNESNPESINSSSSLVSSSLSSSSSESSKSSKSYKSYGSQTTKDWHEPTSTITTNPISTGTMGGCLIDIAIGCYLEVGVDYICSFKPSDVSDISITVSTTDESILVAETDDLAPGKIVLKPKAIGDAILLIRSVELDCLVYRNVVKVRYSYSKEEIADLMYERVDKWVSTGIYGAYIMSFLENDPLHGVINGDDGSEYTTIVFDLVYKNKITYGGFNFYVFDIEVDPDNSSTMRTFTEVWVSLTGFNILVYYSEGLLEQFFQTRLVA